MLFKILSALPDRAGLKKAHFTVLYLIHVKLCEKCIVYCRHSNGWRKQKKLEYQPKTQLCFYLFEEFYLFVSKILTKNKLA